MSDIGETTLTATDTPIARSAGDLAKATIRDQIASVVYERTSKGAANVTINSIELGHSRATRTHVVGVTVGWNDHRQPRKSNVGLKCSSDAELREHARNDSAVMREAIEADLKALAASQAGFTTQAPGPGRYNTYGKAAHSNIRCTSGCLDGEITCTDCHGMRKVRCHAACDSGKTMCHTCYGRGTVTWHCPAGCINGQVTNFRTEQKFDYATNTTIYVNITEQLTCSTCRGSSTRQDRCTAYGCLHGRVTCSGCSGMGTVSCGRCNASGRILCYGCTGTSYTSLEYSPIVRVDEQASMTIAEPEGAPLYQCWNDPDFVAAEAVAVSARRCVDQLTLTTETDLQFPYASGLIQIDDIEVPFLALGASLAVHDLDGIVAKVMEDDIVDVEAGPPGQRDDAIRRLLSSQFGKAAVAHHARGGSSTETSSSSADEFQRRVGRALDAESRARAIKVHARALVIAAGAAFAAAVIFPLLNHSVSPKIPMELFVVFATGLTALWARRRLHREGPLGSGPGGVGVMRDLLRRQRIHRWSTWGYVAIAVVGITIAVNLSWWLADRAAAG